MIWAILAAWCGLGQSSTHSLKRHATREVTESVGGRVAGWSGAQKPTTTPIRRVAWPFLGRQARGWTRPQEGEAGLVPAAGRFRFARLAVDCGWAGWKPASGRGLPTGVTGVWTRSRPLPTRGDSETTTDRDRPASVLRFQPASCERAGDAAHSFALALRPRAPSRLES